MSIYEPVLAFLDETINESKEEFILANTVVEEFCFLDRYSMSRLLKANARAQAALAIKAIIQENSTEQDQVKVLSQIRNLMDTETKAGSYSVAGFYEKIIKALTSELVEESTER